MKFKKLTFLVLASMAMGALIGCGQKKSEPQPDPTPGPGPDPTPQPETMPDEYDLLKYWSGNEAENFYSVEEKTDSTVITYTDVAGEDADGWAFVGRSFSYDSAKVAKFTEYKKLIFSGKLEKTAGTDVVLLKFQGPNNRLLWQKKFALGTEAKTFELSLKFIANWSEVESIYLFANRNTNESGSGAITFTKMALAKAEVVAANDLDPFMPDVPQAPAIYDGLAEGADSFNVNYRWGYASMGGIGTTALANDQYKFQWGGSILKGDNYEYVSSHIQNGQAKLQESGLKRIVFEVVGTAGQSAIFKFEATTSHLNKELAVDLTGEKQVVEVDITSALGNADDVEFMAMIMPAPGRRGQIDAGELTLEKCYLDKTEVYVPVNVGKFPQAWLETVYWSDEAYEVTQEENKEHSQIITYNLETVPDFRSVQYKAKFDAGWGVENYRRVAGKFTADVDVQILVKPFNQTEIWINLEAGVPYVLDQELEAAKVNLNDAIYLMIGTSSGSAKTGHIRVEGFRLARVTANVDDVHGVVRLNRVNNPAAYTCKVNKSGDLQVSWKFTEPSWSFMELTVSSMNAAGLSKLLGTLVSTANVHVGLKPRDANEQTYALTAGEPLEINQNIVDRLDDAYVGKVVIFLGYDANDALEGTITFENFRLTDGENDTTFVDLPVGNYFSSQAIKDTAPDALKGIARGTQVEILLTIGADESVSFRLADQAFTTELVSFNKVNGVLTMKATHLLLGEIEVSAKLNVAKELDNVSIGGIIGENLEYNGYFKLTSNFKFWDCEGTTEQLQKQFNRRWDDPWKKDGCNGATDNQANNSDRFESEANGLFGKGMKVRAWSSGRYAFSAVDFEQAFTCKNISFWVYNSGSADINLQAFVYKGTGWGNNMQVFSGKPAKAGQWTYISVGFTSSAIYSFQIVDSSKTGVKLVYDDFCLY